MTSRLFFVDENLPPQLAGPLGRVFRAHRFLTAERANLRGVFDTELFGDLAERGVDAIITNDAMQMTRDDERSELRARGLHWVGVPSLGPGVKGTQLLAAITGVTLVGLHHVLEHWHTTPHAYRLAMPERFAHREPDIERL